MPEPQSHADFDAFWGSQRHPITMFGAVYTAGEMPLKYGMMLATLPTNPNPEAAITEIIDAVFAPGTYQEWKDKGISETGVALIISWLYYHFDWEQATKSVETTLKNPAGMMTATNALASISALSGDSVTPISGVNTP